MKRLLVLPLFLLSSNMSMAKGLPTITVVSQRFPTKVEMVGRNVEVITQDEIKKLPVRSVNELLSYLSDVDVRTRGIAGTQTDFSIGGSNFNDVLILVDGVPINDIQSGHHNGDIPIDIDNIKRIEVVNSGASAIYGSPGIAGMVNIITKKHQKTGMKLTYEMGNNNYNLQGISYTSPILKQTQLSIEVKKDWNSGYRRDTDFNHKTFNVLLNNPKFRVTLGSLDKRFGAGDFYTTFFPNQWEHTSSHLAILKVNNYLRSNLTFNPMISYRWHRDHFILDKYNPNFYSNLHYDDSYMLKVPLEYIGKGLNVATGVEVSRGAIKSNRLGNHYRYHQASFLSLNPHSKKLNVNLDARIDHYNEKFGTQASFGIATAYGLSKTLVLKANAGRSFRIPTFTELYYYSPANRGSKNLKAEHMWHFGIGWEKSLSVFRLSNSIFYRKDDNAIDWLNYGKYYQASNLIKLNTTGTTLNLSAKIHSILMLFGYTYLNSINHSDKGTKYSSNYLRHKLNFSLISNIKGFKTSLSTSYQKRINQKPYLLLNGKVSKNLTIEKRRLKFFLSCQNLLSTNYESISGIPMPGRQFWAGLTLLI